MARAGPGQCQELHILPRSPTWVAEPHAFGPSSAFLDVLEGNWIKTVLSTQNAGIAGATPGPLNNKVCFLKLPPTSPILYREAR